MNSIDKIYICSNCSKNGHDYKHCNEPITSWGIILVKIVNSPITNKKELKNSIELENKDGIKINSRDELTNVCNFMNNIKFLLVRRKHSLGYCEFIRGRYIKDNINGIIYLFQQMTPEEISKLKDNDFDTLWNDFWGESEKNIYKKDYIESKQNFEDLKNKIGVELGLDFYVNNVKSFYMMPEWGYPKGRKKRGESDFNCAIREFCEETGYKKEDIKIISDVKPIIENMIGTNGVSYKHIYYLAEDISNNVVSKNTITSNEIGDIRYFSYEEADQILREYHIEKRNITKNIFMYYLDNMLHDDNMVQEKWTIDADNF
jgi:ADP-ribose pyrophosphatase YjhB (NUDIX family)